MVAGQLYSLCFLWVKTQLMVIKQSILQFCAVIEQRNLVASLPYQCWFQLKMSRCSSRWLQNEATTWELEFLFSVFVFSFLVFCLSIRLYTSKAEVVSSANHNKPRLCDEPITAQHQLQSARNRQEQISCAQNLKLITKSLNLKPKM